jgi:hypothetical protein
LPPDEAPPLWALGAAGFSSITRTADEWSVVCSETAVPPDVRAERGWRIFQVAGPLDFSLVGILASLVVPLAEAGVSIFALSTYETDFLMVRSRDHLAAIRALETAGHRVRH